MLYRLIAATIAICVVVSSAVALPSFCDKIRKENGVWEKKGPFKKFSSGPLKDVSALHNCSQDWTCRPKHSDSGRIHVTVAQLDACGIKETTNPAGFSQIKEAGTSGVIAGTGANETCLAKPPPDDQCFGHLFIAGFTPAPSAAPAPSHVGASTAAFQNCVKKTRDDLVAKCSKNDSACFDKAKSTSPEGLAKLGRCPSP